MPFLSLKQYVQGHSLVFHACEYNHDHKIIIYTQHGEMKPQRDGDQSLMSIAITNFGTDKKLRAIQRVQMKLGIVHLSGITSADGEKMNINCFTIKNRLHTRNTYDWPIKHQVSKSDYTTWRNSRHLQFPSNSLRFLETDDY